MIRRNAFKLFMFILALGQMKAWAINVPCLHNEFAKGIPDLVQQARMYGDGPETRKELNLVAKKLGFTPAEVKQLLQTVGALYCPAEGQEKQASGTAFVLGDSQEIVTAAHVVMTDLGSRDLTKCFFENFEDPPQRKYLMANSPRNLLPKWLATSEGSEDRARLKLSSRLKNVKPLKFSKQALVAGQNSVLLGAQNVDFRGTGKYPIAVSCPPASVSGESVSSCCNTDGGGSGGPHIDRDENGELAVQAMLVGLSAKLKEGTIPNKTPCSGSNHNYSVILDDRFAN